MTFINGTSTVCVSNKLPWGGHRNGDERIGGSSPHCGQVIVNSVRARLPRSRESLKGWKTGRLPGPSPVSRGSMLAALGGERNHSRHFDRMRNHCKVARLQGN